MAEQYTVAISADFFKAYAKLQKPIQNKVLPLVNKFRENPAQPGLNYEKLNYIDSKLISLRVNDNYRCIVMRSGTVYVLLWVDAHDAAYAWARNRKCTVDAHTGALQILVVREEYERQADQADDIPQTVDSPADGTAQQEEKAQLCPWADYADERLALLGIPEELRGELRSVTRGRLAAYEGSFSTVTWECLQFLLEGDPWEDVEAILLESRAEKPVDADDYKAALDNPVARSRFMVDPKEHDLESALAKPLEQWRVFLHPAQYTLVNREWNGPVRVLGGAGTGKTVAAMHRVRWLAARCPDDKKILFTTFSTTLADDLRQNMASLCSPEEMSRIEIINLDKWVYAYLRRENFQYELCTDDVSTEIWKTVTPLDGKFDRAFLQEEWRDVIQPQEIMTFESYVRASRVGRGRGITRADRKQLWPSFEEYRIILRDRQLLEPDDAMRMARERVLANGTPLYWAVVVDEAQDMSVQALKLLRALTEEKKNDLFIVGDGHQRIYRKPVSLKSCGISITGRSRKLRINYRTTEEIRKQAAAYLKGVSIDDLDGGLDGDGQYISLMHGLAPERALLGTFDERIRFIVQTVAELGRQGVEGADICVTLPGNQDVDRYYKALTESGVEAYKLTKGASDNRRKKGVRLATMHRVKGLEFIAVILVDTPRRQAADETGRDDVAVRERSLRYVAATRARQYLFIVETGSR